MREQYGRKEQRHQRDCADHCRVGHAGQHFLTDRGFLFQVLDDFTEDGGKVPGSFSGFQTWQTDPANSVGGTLPRPESPFTEVSPEPRGQFLLPAWLSRWLSVRIESPTGMPEL